MKEQKEQIDRIHEKWPELIGYAQEHATGKGLHTGYRWLQDSFNEYMELSDKVPGYGMGGQLGSMHNREVLAEKILLELGPHVGGRHAINDAQEAKLKESLTRIAHEQGTQLGYPIRR